MRRRIKKRQNNEGGAPKWMVTYSDMVTLILVFFILLFSMSQIDLNKFESITQSFRNRGILDFSSSSIPSEDITSDEEVGDGIDDTNDLDDLGGPDDEIDNTHLEAVIDQLEALEQRNLAIGELYSDVGEFLESEGIAENVTALRTEEGVHLVLADNILFNPGQADILELGEEYLNKVGQLLTSISNDIRVEGHTDDVPMSSYRFPSNWELSGARAGRVVRHLIEAHDITEKRFLIAGYGETRPVAPNDTAENRSKNRRVEIVILQPDIEQ